MEPKRGSYLGTTLNGKWWRRYRGEGMFMRGTGDFWLDQQGLHLRRFLTKKPIFIGYREMRRVDLGKVHAGRWVMGLPVIKIHFSRHDLNLCAGLVLARRWEEARLIQDLLHQQITIARRQ